MRSPGWSWKLNSQVTTTLAMLVPGSGQVEHGRRKDAWTVPSQDCSTKSWWEEHSKEDRPRAVGSHQKLWSKASLKESKNLVVTEVARVEEDKLVVKSVSQCQQGQLTKWEGILPRSVGWSDLWKMPQARLSFHI